MKSCNPRYPVKYESVNNVTLAYSELGSGYPIVLINGFASTMDMWNPPVLEALAGHFRVIIFDNRGTGFSGDTEQELTVPLMAADTAGLMDALGITAAHILGFSMGASVAQELALMFPEKVSRLVMVAGECGGQETVMMEPDIQARLMDKSGSVQDVVDRMFSLIFPASWLACNDPAQHCPDVYETTTETIAARQATALFGWGGSFSRLPAIRSPVMAITGSGDCIVPPVNSRLICGQIPHAGLVEIPGGGHGLMYQFPDQVSATVLDFLRRSVKDS